MSKSGVQGLCWFDGSIRSLDDVRVHPLASSHMYATGCFEGIRAYATKNGPGVFRLREHMERFKRSALTYGMVVPYDVPTLCAAVVETLKVNKVDAAYIRPVAYYGLAEKTLTLAPELTKVETHVCIATLRLDNYLGADMKGLKCTLSRYEKFSSNAMPATSKSFCNYANSTLAFTDAVKRGFHEAILLNKRGEVCEATAENIFVVKGGRIATNDESADILLGITRDTVMTLARDHGIPLEIRALTLTDLNDADEVFLTGTGAEIAPIASLDDHVYSAARPVTDTLNKAFRRAIVGEDEKHPDWVTLVA